MFKKVCKIRYLALMAIGLSMLGAGSTPASARTYWVRYYYHAPVVYHWRVYRVYHVYRPYW